ncbi:MAG TPA: hypothetical protein VFC34_12220 [Puia sp.]|nr:hypothetical protein [Puia sp.]
MDADVITIETSRSQMELLEAFADFSADQYGQCCGGHAGEDWQAAAGIGLKRA